MQLKDLYTVHLGGILSNQNVAAKQLWPDICKLLSITQKLNLSEDLFVDTCIKILARKTLKFLATKMT